MATIHDNEFGEITIRRSAMSRGMKLSVAPNGSLRISMPKYAPLFMAKRLVSSSRGNIRQLYAQHTRLSYSDGMQLGKSHTLSVIEGSSLSARRHGRMIVLSLPAGTSIDSNEVHAALGPEIISALRQEAKSYLPRRVEYLAKQHGFSFTKARFSHASSRWGSCSSSGTISLNIALMMLPFEVIDYVIIHELCHTKQMNHSQSFWTLVAEAMPDYKSHRAKLSESAPHIM